MKDTNDKKEIENRRCIYCGESLHTAKYQINPGAAKPLYCCDTPCYQKMRRYIEWDNRNRKYFYGLLCAMIVINMIMIGFHLEGFFQFFPMIGICITVIAFPMVFSRYEYYERFGLVTTRKIIRGVAGGLALFAVAMSIVAS